MRRRENTEAYEAGGGINEGNRTFAFVQIDKTTGELVDWERVKNWYRE